jgi:hypothetical protein
LLKKGNIISFFKYFFVYLQKNNINILIIPENIMKYSELITLMKEYCKYNNIIFDAFKKECMEVGFNVVRFGNSPKDNFLKQNNIIERVEENKDNVAPKKRSGRPKKFVQDVVKKEENNAAETTSAAESKKDEVATEMEPKKKETVKRSRIKIIKK